jgi:hypothetical protein
MRRKEVGSEKIGEVDKTIAENCNKAAGEERNASGQSLKFFIRIA